MHPARPRALASARPAETLQDAARLLGTFGWLPHSNVPVCLDIEQITYEHNPAATLAYAGAWVAAVRADGFVPGIYGSAKCRRRAAKKTRPRTSKTWGSS